MLVLAFFPFILFFPHLSTRDILAQGVENGPKSQNATVPALASALSEINLSNPLPKVTKQTTHTSFQKSTLAADRRRRNPTAFPHVIRLKGVMARGGEIVSSTALAGRVFQRTRYAAQELPSTFKTAPIPLATPSCSFIRKPAEWVVPNILENSPRFFCRLWLTVSLLSS